MELSNFYDVSNFSASQGILHILKKQSPVPTMSQINPVPATCLITGRAILTLKFFHLV